jgi:hypothetical protein
MIKNKNAQGLSMNTIIIATLAILVLVVIAIIFSGKIRDGNNTMRTCESLGGRCEQNCSKIGGMQKIGDSKTTNCESECCLSLYG